MDLDMSQMAPEATSESMDLLSRAWCSSAIQVFQPTLQDVSMNFNKKPVMALEHDKTTPLSLQNSDKSLKADDDDLKSVPQWKFDDLKSWIWLQKAIHPELDYDLCLRKKWFSQKIPPWNGISIKKWMKEMKQKRKEDKRLQRAEVHAAISVAGVAAALAALAAENAEPSQSNALKDIAVASAAALVAQQCAQVAEAVGAKHEQLTSAINAAMTATDASNIITLTAAAATSLRGAATLRGRPGQRERIKETFTPKLVYDEFDFNFGRCSASVAKGDEIFVATPDGRCRLRSVSAVLNRDAKVILKIKKINFLMAFSSAKESIVYDLHVSPIEEPINEAESYSISMTTSRGRIELKIEDYVKYKKWMMTINHMLMFSTTFNGPERQF
ncbi:VAN3-binding protein isoform X1 [Elaeis guineensis]